MIESEFFAQDEFEFNKMLKFINGNSILEVGSRYGESLRRLAQTMRPGSRVVSVDLGCEEHGDYLTRCIDDLSADGYDARLIKGDSHDAEIIERVRLLGSFDFVFIDGDHSRDGVMADYKNYAPMAKIIGFHDIMLPTIKPAWERIKTDKQVVEIVNYKRLTPGRQDMGIGIIFTGN